jgi:hypothetical protein
MDLLSYTQCKGIRNMYISSSRLALFWKCLLVWIHQTYSMVLRGKCFSSRVEFLRLNPSDVTHAVVFGDLPRVFCQSSRLLHITAADCECLVFTFTCREFEGLTVCNISSSHCTYSGLVESNHSSAV